ncbi:hypothetical protein D3C85_1028140 [compost metagenome]
MGNVNIHRAELSGHALRQRTNAVLGTGKCGEPGCATQACSGAGEQDRAPLALGHAFGHFTRIEKTGKTGHFPDLEILAGGFFENAARHVGADVEHECLDGADLAFDLLDQCHHIVFLAGVAGETVGLATIGLYGIHQWLELVRTAAGNAGDKTLPGKTLGNGATRGITCTDDKNDLLVIHG